MTDTAAISLTIAEREHVVAILRAHLPDDSRAYVFGSRTTRQVKPYADLDLAIQSPRRLTIEELSALAEAFSTSDLPWKVDVVEIDALEPSFRRIIEPQFLRVF